MSKFLNLLICFILSAGYGKFSHAQYNGASQFEPVYIDNTVHQVADSVWDVNSRGNHRVIVSVKQPVKNAVRLVIPWRRADVKPHQKRIIIREIQTGKEIKNIYINKITHEEGSIAFQPLVGYTNYEVYYLPYIFRERSDDARYGAPWNDYLKAEYKDADAQWLSEVRLNFGKLPEAKVLRFEARKQEDFFTAMGLIAIPKETEALVSAAKPDYSS